MMRMLQRMADSKEQAQTMKGAMQAIDFNNMIVDVAKLGDVLDKDVPQVIANEVNAILDNMQHCADQCDVTVDIARITPEQVCELFGSQHMASASSNLTEIIRTQQEKLHGALIDAYGTTDPASE